MWLSKLPETESDEIYQSDESPSPTFVEETNAVDENTDAGTENDVVPPVCENFAANTNDMNKTIEENIVEDDIVVIPEDANANNTAPVQETDPLNNPDIGMRSGIIFFLSVLFNTYQIYEHLRPSFSFGWVG